MLNFDSPNYISPNIIQDQLQISFNGSQYLFMSAKYNLTLDSKYWNLTFSIPKQID